MTEEEKIASTAAAASIKSFLLGWGMILTYVVFNSLGAMILKSQIQKLGDWNFSSASSVFHFFVRLFSHWETWFGLISITIATAGWIIALAHLELSKAYPVAIGLNLLILIGMAALFFNEPMNFSKIFGVLLIFSGVLFVFR